MPKKEAQRQKLALSREQYLDVIPSWCYGKSDGWERLVDRWLGQNAEFAAKSSKNWANQGTNETHGQGNQGHWRHKKVQEDKLKRPLSEIESWKLARVRSKRKDGEGEYYGKTDENLIAYTESYQRFHPGPAIDEPIQSKNDEMAVVAIQPKKHGRCPVLDGVITPSVSYTRLRATNQTSSRAPAQPSQDMQHAAYIDLIEAHPMQNGTVPTMEPPPPCNQCCLPLNNLWHYAVGLREPVDHPLVVVVLLVPLLSHGAQTLRSGEVVVVLVLVVVLMLLVVAAMMLRMVVALEHSFSSLCFSRCCFILLFMLFRR